MPPSSSRDYAGIAADYEAGVLAGEIPVGALYRLAVERQKREEASPPEGFSWKAQLADKACEFAGALAFPKGAKRGERFVLEPWQVWLLRVLFGWIDSVTGSARFHRSTIFLPKGNGKTPLAAIIALNVLARGKRIGAKVFSAASTQKQAREVFEAAQEMLRLSPELREVAELVVGEHAIRGIGDNRAFEPISSESGSAEGKVPDCVVVDEIHVHPNRKLYDNLCSAASKVEGSRVVVISTAGNDMSPTAIGYQVYCEARDILKGVIDAPSQFALISEADRDLDPWEEGTWRQANPNLGVSVSIRNFKTAAAAVKNQPSAQYDFFAKRLGWWSQTSNAFMDVQRWNALANPNLRIEDFAGEPMTIGLDLAATRDLTARPAVHTWIREDGKRAYRVFTRGRAYLPERSPTVNQDFKRWSDEGWIVLTDGEVMDYVQLREDIAEDCERHPGSEVCFDPWSAQPIANELNAEGIATIEVRQGARTQSTPMKELEAAVLDGRLEHDGSPVMALCIGNLIARADRNGNIAPDRENENKKIDLAVGLINALVRACSGDTGEAHVGDDLVIV